MYSFSCCSLLKFSFLSFCVSMLLFTHCLLQCVELFCLFSAICTVFHLSTTHSVYNCFICLLQFVQPFCFLKSEVCTIVFYNYSVCNSSFHLFTMSTLVLFAFYYVYSVFLVFKNVSWPLQCINCLFHSPFKLCGITSVEPS